LPNSTEYTNTARVEDQTHQRQLSGVLPPELEHRVLPPDQPAQHEHHRYSRQSNQHYQRVGLFHHVQAFFMPEHLHYRHRSIGDRRPVHRAHQQTPGYERTRLADDPVECVEYAHEQATVRVQDYVGVVALGAGYFHRALAVLFLVDPALQADLVNPLGSAAALAGRDPLS